jgi:phage gp36-like protein
VTAYCAATDLELPDETVADFTSDVIDDAIAKGSSLADSYLSTRWTLPLRPVEAGVYPQALVEAVAAIATYRLMKRRGYSPENGDNDEIRNGFDDAIRWLKDMSAGKATMQIAGSNSEAEAQEGGGPSSSAFMLQAPQGDGYGYDREEDFWHDSGSAVTGGVRRRGF